MRTQLRKMREELAQMEMAGKRGTKAFKELANRAGELADQAGDTGQRIKILASDTKNLDAAMSAGTGLAGGFSLAEGAMAIFGKEGENLQRQLVRLQGGMNMLNGLQSVANTLNKDSAVRVVLAAKAQQLYSMAVGTSTGTMKAFRIALLATGIGALIVGIGMLVANWGKLSASIKNTITPQTEINKRIQEQVIILERLREKMSDANDERDRENAILEAQGINEEKIFKNKMANLENSIEEKEKEIALTKDRITEQQNLLNEYNKEKGYFESIKEGAKILFGLKDSAGEIVNKNKELNATLKEQEKALEDLGSQQKVLTVSEEKRVKDALKQNKDLLRDRVNAAKLTQLEGKERIDEEEKIALQEVDILKKNLEKTYKLTKTQYEQLDYLKDVVKKNAQKERDKIDEENKRKALDQSEKLKELQRKIEEDQLELVGAGEKEKLELKQKFIAEDIKLLELKGDAESLLIAKNLKQQFGIIQNEINKLGSEKSGFSIWKLLGIDAESEKGKEAIEALKQSTSIIMDQINQAMQAELAQAEQHTQVIEQRLDEAKSQLDEELDLQEKGLANNVDAKRQEIAQLKIEKEKALEEEKKAQKAQLLIDSASQLSSLITASATLWKTSTIFGPILGPILAIATIATMFGTFAAAKIKANEAINAKLEAGGFGDSTGIISGKRHSQGGEKFTDYIEVEQGETWGVFNRTATQKYGKFIPEMVESMNSLKFNPYFNLKNSTSTINIDTKQMQFKLDSIDSGIRTLNENMANQIDSFYAGKTKIVKLNNHHTRIIHATN